MLVKVKESSQFKNIMVAVAATESDILSSDAVAYKMTVILVTMAGFLWGTAVFLQTPSNTEGGIYLPCPKAQPSKRAYEIYNLSYTPIWICCFGAIVATGVYEQFTAWTYNIVCIGLALPILLQPIFYTTNNSPDKSRKLMDRYCTKANAWIAVFSFIGNYWYTHYFYSVLKANYSMPAHRLNDVPIALYFATHFYFSTYHCFSNLLLRKITTSYKDTFARKILFWGTIVCFSYFTAFMETLTISSFPYYSFEDREMVCTFEPNAAIPIQHLHV